MSLDFLRTAREYLRKEGYKVKDEGGILVVSDYDGRAMGFLWRRSYEVARITFYNRDNNHFRLELLEDVDGCEEVENHMNYIVDKFNERGVEVGLEVSEIERRRR